MHPCEIAHHVALTFGPSAFDVINIAQQQSKQADVLMMCTGDICVHSTLHFEVGGGSFGGECAGQPVQQPQEAGRPFPQQHCGSDPGPCH